MLGMSSLEFEANFTYLFEKSEKWRFQGKKKTRNCFLVWTHAEQNKCLESYAFPTCIDGGWSRWMWPLMPFSRSIEQPHSTVQHMLCASSQRDMYLTFTQCVFVCIFVFVCICVCVRLCVLVYECMSTSNAQTNFLSIEASALTIPPKSISFSTWRRGINNNRSSSSLQFLPLFVKTIVSDTPIHRL